MSNLLVNIFCYKIKSVFEMPKYAVAVGRKVGIYDTYDECKAQVNGFPGAKFKKFPTLVEAEEFIGMWSNPAKPRVTYGKPSNVPAPTRIENKSVPEFSKVEKISPSNGPLNSLYQRLTNFEDKLNKFMSDTTASLDTLNGRVTCLEKRFHPGNETESSISKKAKMDSDSSSFLKSDQGITMVFTDGACTNNGQKGAKAGIGVWFNHNHPLNQSAPVIGPATNNTAEIQAARVAIEVASEAGVKSLCIHTDSKFLINCISDWIHKWEQNGWQLSSGGPVKNKEEIVKLKEALQKMEFIEWVYVTAHKGIEGNEMADKLAREGALHYKKSTAALDSV